MLRRLMFLAMMLLALGTASVAPLASASSDASNVFQTGPTYHYTLKEDKNPAVCKHMLILFNDKFTRLWDAPPMTSLTNDPIYSPDGKYAFPRLPGVKYNAEVTFNWRFFAQPTSPEFSAIHWKQGMAVAGGCPAGKICPGENPQPILIGHFDFDNDGTLDTVIKLGFFDGYLRTDRSQEYLIVWRDQLFTIRGVANLWNLAHPKDQALTPIYLRGLYVRPFIYRNQTYVTKYILDFGESDNSSVEPALLTWTRPKREDILVRQYSFTRQKEAFTGWPTWTTRTICDFEMKPLD